MTVLKNFVVGVVGAPTDWNMADIADEFIKNVRPTHPPTHLIYLPTYLPTHPPTHLPSLPPLLIGIWLTLPTNSSITYVSLSHPPTHPPTLLIYERM